MESAEVAKFLREKGGIAMALILIVFMILLMVCGTALSTATKKGEMMRESCGNEYLEAETDRWELKLAWGENEKEGVRARFKGAVMLNLVMVSVGILVLGMILLAYKDFKLRRIFELNSDAVVVAAGLVCLLSLVTLFPLGIVILDNKWYDSKVEYTKDSAEYADKYLKEKVYPSLITVIGMVGVASIVGMVVYSATATAPADSQPGYADWGLLALTLFGLVILVPIYKRFLYFQYQVEDYLKKGAEIDTSISVPEDKRVEAYLQQNMTEKNAGTYADNKAKGELFLYVKHRDGNEGEFLPTEGMSFNVASLILAKITTVLDTLLSDSQPLLKILKSNLEARMNAVGASIGTGSSLGELTVASEQLQGVVEESLASNLVKACELVKLGPDTPACEGRLYARSGLAAEIKWKEVTKYAETTNLIDDFLENNIVITSDQILPKEGAKTLAKAAFLKEVKDQNGNKEPGADENVATAIGTFINKLTSADGLTNGGEPADLTNFNQAVLKKGIIEVLNDKILAIVDSIRSESNRRLDLQKRMLGLRQHQLTKEARDFVDIIYGVSVTIAVLVFGALYAFLVTKRPGSSLWVALGMVIAVFVAALVGWFLGVFWLQ